MKKFVTLIAALCLVLGVYAIPQPTGKKMVIRPTRGTMETVSNTRKEVAAEDSTFDFSKSMAKGWTASTSPTGFESTNRGMQFNKPNNVTLTLKNAKNVTKIVVTCSANANSGSSIAVKVGTTSFGSESLVKEANVVKTFSHAAADGDIVLTLNASNKSIYIKQIVVTGDIEDSGDPEEELDDEWLYDEPTKVVSSDSIGSNTAYSFITNNIKVECVSGAQNNSYFSCNAGSSITFTATEKIKGIRVNGYIKKGFSATASSGTISYEDASDDAVEEDPVLLIKDISSKTVTIECVKQLRCYQVDVYFEANPTDSIGGGSTPKGDLSSLGGIEIDYYPSYSEVGSYNYSVLLYNPDETADYYPMLQFDIYTSTEKDYAGTYSTSGSNMGEYNYYVVSDDDYTVLTAANFTITKNEGGTYTIAGTATDENGTYSFSVTAEAEYYNGEYPYEPETASTLNLSITAAEADDSYADYGFIDLYLTTAEGELMLGYVNTGTTTVTEIPNGTYTIEASEYDDDYSLQNESDFFEAGYYSSYSGYPAGCVYATESEYYYLVSGSVKIESATSGKKITVNGTSYYGSTIKATYTGALAVDDVVANETTTSKIMRNGQVYIVRNGQTFTLLGSEVK